MAISSACTDAPGVGCSSLAASAADTPCASRMSRPVTQPASADCSRSTARSARMSTRQVTLPVGADR